MLRDNITSNGEKRNFSCPNTFFNIYDFSNLSLAVDDNKYRNTTYMNDIDRMRNFNESNSAI